MNAAEVKEKGETTIKCKVPGCSGKAEPELYGYCEFHYTHLTD